MNRDTMRELLNQGIEPVIVCLLKWTDIDPNNKRISYKSLLQYDNCAFCDSYFYNTDCEGCPIMIKTGYECCEQTPYGDVVKAISTCNWKIAEEERLNMVDFLEEIASDMGIVFFEEEYEEKLKEAKKEDK